MCLIRSSYEPHPLPEVGRKKIDFTVYPSPAWSEEEATRMGMRFNFPLIPVRTAQRKAVWSSEHSFFCIEPENVLVIAFKAAEDSDGTIVRLFESSGKSCMATVRSERKIIEAYEIDLLERRSAREPIALREDGRVSLNLDAHEVKTVLVRFK